MCLLSALDSTLSLTHWCRGVAFAALLLLMVCLARPSAAQDVPPWPASSVVYCVFPSIFSPGGNLAGVTAQLPRLKTLGVTDVWLMPVTPVGRAVNGHPSFGSPYAVQDYYAINPAYGSEADLRTLVTTAHRLGLRVILDEVLNHTSWDNPLITQHPEYYVHTRRQPEQPGSIQQALTYPDVAQLNYANPALRTYVTEMLRSWITRYGVDGFRFDSASNPDGPGRLIPADFWQDLGRSLRLTKPDVLLLGESETPDLALKPFALDYGWHVYDALRDATNGGDAARVVDAWHWQVDRLPARHGAPVASGTTGTSRATSARSAGRRARWPSPCLTSPSPACRSSTTAWRSAMRAAASTRTRRLTGPAATRASRRFTTGCSRCAASNPALQQGTMTWLTNSVPHQVLTYERTGGGAEFLVEINVSPASAQGTVTAPSRDRWTPVPLLLPAAARAPASPLRFSLPAHGFAVFRRTAAEVGPACVTVSRPCVTGDCDTRVNPTHPGTGSAGLLLSGSASGTEDKLVQLILSRGATFSAE